MDESKKKIERLFQRYLDNECTADEIKALLEYFDFGENEQLLRDLIQKQFAIQEEVLPVSDHSSLSDKTFRRIKRAISVDKSRPETFIIPLYKRFWFRICAAAVLIFLIIVPALYFPNKKNERTIAQKEKIVPVKDIQPGRNTAVLTLSNGTQILLDSAGNGTLAQQGSVKVLKINGQIAYRAADRDVNSKPVYNTISTAKGNEYLLILADGTKVWLNAASSIHFPAFFATNERKVEITGEAYFEVAHDRLKPFKVEFSNAKGEKGEIEVLGTHFDVNAYPNEDGIKTTLLEGSVKVSKGNKSTLITPGEQAVVSNSPLAAGEISLKKDVDVAQVIAWKDGYFLFNNTDIQTIMRQVARWYDVEVNFEGKIPSDGFTGRISRDVPLSKFLKVLELNDVHVKTEGRKVTVIF